MSCEESLRTLCLSCLQKKKLKTDFIALYYFLRSGNGMGDADLFSLMISNRIRGNGTKLHQGNGSDCLVGKKKIYCSKKSVVKHWNKLLNQASCQSVFKSHFRNALNNMLYLLGSPEVFKQVEQLDLCRFLKTELFNFIIEFLFDFCHFTLTLSLLMDEM